MAAEGYAHTRVETLIALRVSTDPHNVVLRMAGEGERGALTAEQLLVKSQEAARRLEAAGVTAGDRVILISENRPEAVVAYFAILTAKATAVVLDPIAPRNMLAHLIERSDARAMIVSEKVLHKIDADLARGLPVLNEQLEFAPCEGFASSGDQLLPPTGDGDPDIAAILYTSGTTGDYKGVPLTHEGIAASLQESTSIMKLSAADRFLTLLPMYHVYPLVQGILTPLYAGSSVTFVETMEESRILQAIAETRPTILLVVPRILELFYSKIQAGMAKSWVPNVILKHTPQLGTKLRSMFGGELRFFVSGGAALERRIQREMTELGLTVLQGYGLTETCGAICATTPDDNRIGSVGKAYSCCEIKIDSPDSRGQGEICVKGPVVLKGYFRDADATEQSIVDGWFHTGDLGMIDGEGFLRITGRIKEVIVTEGGEKAMPADVERLYAGIEGVKELAVVGVPAVGRKGDEIHAAVVIDRGAMKQGETEQGLKDRVEASIYGRESELPFHLRIQRVHFLHELPKTVMQKVRRHLLEDIFRLESIFTRRAEKLGEEAIRAHEYIAPRDERERALVEIWQEVLKEKEVGIRDSFVWLGGDSLSLTQVASRIREQLHVDIPLSRMIGCATIEELAVEVAWAEPYSGPPIIEVSRESDLALSYAQERLWFLDQLEPYSVRYSEAHAVRIEGELRLDILEEAFTGLVERHESLRTVFENREGHSLQIIKPAEPFKIPVVDLSAQPEDAREGGVQELAAVLSQTPFNLTTGPLLRVNVIRLGDSDHVLLLNVHHIISDGWSMGVLIREVGERYSALLEGRRATLPPLQIQYADFAAWQRTWLEGGELERQLEYWKGNLSGAPDLINLPTDYPRPAIESYKGRHMRFRMREELTERLRGFCQTEGVTLFMALLAAFDVLLYRSSGQEDICVGSPIANRNRKEIEGLIGFFANTLVMRTKVDGDETFRDLLKKVQRTALGAYDHQDMPFEKLVEELKPRRDMSYSPLFQVLMVLQNVPMEAIKLGDARSRLFDFEPGRTKFDLSLSLTEEAGALECEIEYNSDLFRPDTIERMIRHFERILNAVVDNVEAKVSEIELMDDEEKRRVLVEWNDTAAEYPRDKCVHQLFEEQAARTPDAVAVVFEDKQLTYRELNERANQVGHYLKKRGVGPDNFVGICVERSLEMIVGILGILKAGGAYVPLDPAYPEERLEYMIEDSEIRVVLTQQVLAEKIPDAEKISLDRDWEHISREDASDFRSESHPGNLAYVIYTSGSTGRPKGVQILHGAVVNFLMSMAVSPGFNQEDRMFAVTTYSFDISVLEMFLPLVTGGQVEVASRELVSNVTLLRDHIEERRPSVMQTTPALLGMLLDAGWQNAAKAKILCGGEAFSESLRGRLIEQGAEVWNMYGPTETTIWSTTSRILADQEITIGRPIENTTIYILNEKMKPVPVGVVGDLYIGGDGLSRGYLRRPELTSQSFIPNPYGSNNGERLYRTGDLARYSADGDIHFLGRKDTQVKVRGFRIECGEIEAVLSEHEGIKDVAVVARQEGETARLIAYVVPRESEKKLTASELRGFLGQKLPDYMIPSAFVPLNKLPLTPSGKIDRKVLPEPEGALGVMGEYVAPRNEAEQTLSEIWKEMLKVGRVGVNDNFFDLGGHSLLVTQVISRIRERFKVELPVKAMFESPTIEGLARQVTSGRGSEIPPIVRVGREGELPLSYAQERLWFLDQLEPENIAYNISGAVRLQGAVQLEVLEEAFTRLVERHEGLRTVFEDRDGRPLQVIRQAERFHIAYVDFGSESPEMRELRAREIVNEEARAPFHLSTGPLLRAKLIRISDQDHVLVVAMHHIISDGWSMGVFVQELGELIDASMRGKAARLAPLPIQYADYAAWQRGWLTGGEIERQREYWKEELAGAPSLLNLPTDHPRPAEQSYKGAEERVVIPPDLLDQLKTLSRAEGATLFMTLLAGFNALLCRLSGDEDICIGTPIANRQQHEIEGLIGFFVNTLVVRTRVDGDKDFRELLAGVRKTTLGAYDHQDLPFEKLVEELQPKRDTSYSPLFQAMMVLQNVPMADMEFGGLRIAPYEIDRGISQFDLTLNLREEAGQLAGSVEYCTDLFEAETIRRWITYYIRILEAVARDAATRVSEIELLDEAERRQILVDWNRTEADFPRDKCIHQLLEEQVARTPEAKAVLYDSRSLTYRELNERANQLGHYLQKKGIGPDKLVGICVERSLEMIVGILGTLKAGGAYVPLDPRYPDERLQYMIEDSGIRVVLTQQALAERIPGAEKISLDRDWEDISREDDANLPVRTQPENLAYVIYTSGSTGKPKGVAIEHRNTVALIAWSRDLYSPEELGCVLCSTSICFDLFVFELFAPLTVGGSIVLVNSLLDFNAQESPHQVRLINTVPSAIKEFIRSGEIPPSVRTVNLAGEPLKKAIVEGLYRFEQVTKVYDLYGPSEDTTYSTCKLRERGGIETIGRPLTNKRSYILDHALKPVPIGVIGELHVGGVGQSRGYFNRPDLTAENFIPDPYAVSPGMRLYRTGDMARYLPNGDIEFLGRRDHQVKIRGFRIEGGEVESALLQHENIKDALVVAHRYEDGEPELIAYVVAKEVTRQLTATELRQHLQDKLCEYMVPSAFVQLDEMPLTPSGKVDRKGLPHPVKVLGGAEEYMAPRNDVEQKLVGIWQEVLKARPIGVRDNFFDLGGHSLLATQVISRIRKRFKVDVPVKALFEFSTVEALAQAVAQAGVEESPPIIRVSREGELPLSYAQERLWFLDQLEPNNIAYNISDAVRLRGDMRVDVLEKAFTYIVERHEGLRTVFKNKEGKAVQIIKRSERFRIALVDLSNEPSEIREDRARDLVDEEARTPFNLSEGPLLRAKLIKVNDQDHLLVVSMHHIISDGWSMGIIVREMGELIDAFKGGYEPQLPSLDIQYADYSTWQRSWLESGEIERQLKYWKGRLTGMPDLLNLPLDYPRPAMQSYTGTRQSVVISEDLTSKLKELGQTEGVTLFMTLLAAFSILLSRYSGERDISVGSPIANRNRRDLEGLIGFFVNTLVMRTLVNGDESFSELLQKVRKTTIEAYDHQDLPFEKLVEELHPKRDTSYSPLFQVMFVLQNIPIEQIRAGGLRITPYEIDRGVSQFDLTLNLTEKASRLEGVVEYNTDLYKADTIVRMMKHLVRVLNAVADNPKVKVSEIELLDEAERQKILMDWNDTAAEYPRDRCLHEIFEDQALRRPYEVAVVYEDQQLTYRELDERSNKLAHSLMRKGVGPDKIVGISIERSLEMIVGVLGILKAGGAYMPLDPRYPPERLKYMIEDSGIEVLLMKGKGLQVPAEVDVKRIDLEKDWESIAGEGVGNPGVLVHPENLAYVIYTSGSTGAPKGVAMVHRPLVNLINWQVRDEGEKGHNNVLQFASLSFDVSFQEIWTSFATGGTLYVPREEDRADFVKLAEVIESDEINKLFVPNVVLQHLMDEFESGGKDYEYLEDVVTAGEPLEVGGKLRGFFRRHPKARLHNQYGPTEAHVVTELILEGDVGMWNDRPSIGRPIYNDSIYILDEFNNPVPVGVSGELHIGGKGLARGYLNKADLTAEKFVPDPFSEMNGERIYRTGDLARYHPDGNIEFLGRIDTQVKIRGFRVECGEIEAVLSEHEGIKDVVVTARRYEGENRLLAYVVSREAENKLTATELRQYLKERLPEYMIPSAFVPVESFPLTASGKVDRKALPEPEKALGLEVEYVAPRNATEQQLAEIWQRVLRVERVGVNDNFFERGGDSILSIQIISRAAQAGIYLTAKDIFVYQTIAGMAQVALKKRAIEAEQGKIEGIVELSPIQNWLFEGGLAEADRWNQSLLFKVNKELNKGCLERAIQKLVLHHDMLRSSYSLKDGVWVQEVIKENPRIEIEVFDLNGKTKGDVERMLLEETERLQRSLSLGEGRLMAVGYFKLGDDEADRLFITIHHLVVDGVSWRILMEDMARIYEQLRSDKTVELPKKTTSYQYWTRRLKEYANGEQVGQEMEYWLGLVSGKEVNAIHVDNAEGDNFESMSRTVRLRLSASDTQALLEQIPKVYHTQVNDLLLTSVLIALSKWSGKEEGCWLINLEGHGREEIFEEVDLSRTIGWFTILYPVLLAKRTGESIGEMIKGVKECLRSIPNRGIGYGILRYLSSDKKLRDELRDISGAVSFNYLGQVQVLEERSFLRGLAGEHVGDDAGQGNKRKFELYVSGIVTDGELEMRVTYSDQRYRAETVERFAQALENGLHEVIGHCLSPEAGGYTPSDFPMANIGQEELDKWILGKK